MHTSCRRKARAKRNLVGAANHPAPGDAPSPNSLKRVPHQNAQNQMYICATKLQSLRSPHRSRFPLYSMYYQVAALSSHQLLPTLHAHHMLPTFAQSIHSPTSSHYICAAHQWPSLRAEPLPFARRSSQKLLLRKIFRPRPACATKLPSKNLLQNLLSLSQIMSTFSERAHTH